MEQSNELRNANRASSPSPKRGVSNANSSKSIEEGELSSSDDDEYPAGSVFQFSCTTVAGTDPVQVAAEKETTQLPAAGKSVSPSNPVSNVSPKECRTAKSRQNRVDINCRRSLLEKSQISRWRNRNNVRSRSRPRKVSLTRPFVTSATKVNRGSLMVKRTYRANNFNTMKKIKGFGEHVRTQNSNFHNNEVQDLRQLIAVRENAQKFKGAQQNKETTSDSCRDHSLVSHKEASVVSSHFIGPTHSRNQEANHPPVYSAKLPCGANDGSHGTTRITKNNIQRDRMTKLAEASAQMAPKRAKTLQMRTAYLSNGSFWNSMSNNKMDIHSLLELEELLDKELGEAQELRRSCEIEERDTLKTYRNAQRALIEANAKCCHLKLQRDIFPAHFHSLLMENSNLIRSSGPQDYNRGPDVNFDNQHLGDSNVTQLQDGQNEETFMFDYEGAQKKNEICDERRNYVVDESRTVSSQDSLLLEASLRSQLFAKLGTKSSLKKDTSESMENRDESGARIANVGEKMEIEGHAC